MSLIFFFAKLCLSFVHDSGVHCTALVFVLGTVALAWSEVKEEEGEEEKEEEEEEEEERKRNKKQKLMSPPKKIIRNKTSDPQTGHFLH